MLTSVLSLVILGPVSALAAIHASHFECRIIEVFQVDSTGTLRPKVSQVAALYVGKTFVVDRGTGRIAGEWFSTEGATGVEVIRPGDADNAFVATARDSKNFHLIKIDQWKEGARKPFVIFTSFGDVATGLCHEANTEAAPADRR